MDSSDSTDTYQVLAKIDYADRYTGARAQGGMGDVIRYRNFRQQLRRAIINRLREKGYDVLDYNISTVKFRCTGDQITKLMFYFPELTNLHITEL